MAAIVPYVAAALMLVIGVYTLFNIIRQSKRIKASKEWPAITAQVTQKEVVRHRSTKGHVSYIPTVSYKYSVMGSEFNDHTRFGGEYSSLKAEKTLDGIGETIEVRYNPEKPSEHSHGYDKVKFSDILVTIVTLGLGFIVIVSQLYK